MSNYKRSKSVMKIHRQLARNEKRLSNMLMVKMKRNLEAYMESHGMTEEDVEETTKEDPEFLQMFMYQAIDQTPKTMLPVSFFIYKDPTFRHGLVA